MLDQIEKAYSALGNFRAERLRLKRFTFGKQWDDPFTAPNHQRMTEGEYAAKHGRFPLTNNVIHRLVKTLIGHFREQHACTDGKDDHNQLTELDARMFEEFLISGCAVQHLSYERRPGFDKALAWVDNVSPADFFAYPLRDPRALDVEIIGMFHRWSMAEVIGRLSLGSRRRAEELRRIVKAQSNEAPGFEHCGIIEVWHRESTDYLRVHDPLDGSVTSHPVDKQAEIAAENRRRRREGKPRLATRFELHSQWVGRFLTPDGLLLHTVTAPTHPFAVKFYPLIDGEVHSFVSSVIDQQKYINRLITLIDNMMASSAKGVLLFPDTALGGNTNWDRVTELWADYNGIIPYKHEPGSPGPHQVVTDTTPLGAYNLLNLELSLFDRISGVNDALKGEAGGNSAQLYDAQTRNSLASISDIFAAFNSFRTSRDAKMENLR